MNTNQYDELLAASGCDILVGLDPAGNELRELARVPGATRHPGSKLFPLVVDGRTVSREQQIEGAQKFRDRIEYIYSPENDRSHPMLATWRLDDTARLQATLKLPFGGTILEAGCSSGTVAIEIAKLDSVCEVVGVDLRPDAIETASRLLLKLVDQGNLSATDALKLKFQVTAVEDAGYVPGYFDSVCAFEILEHLTEADFHAAMANMLRMLSPSGAFLMSVPNRYPAERYIEAKRTRWNAPDHKNYFSRNSLEYLLKRYFETVIFHPVGDEPIDTGVYLLAECQGKRSLAERN